MRRKVWALRFWGAIKIHLEYQSKIRIPGPHSKPLPSDSLGVGRHLCPLGMTHWDSEGLEGETPCSVLHCWWCFQERCQGTLHSWWSWLDWHQEKRILKPWCILHLSVSWKVLYFQEVMTLDKPRRLKCPKWDLIKSPQVYDLVPSAQGDCHPLLWAPPCPSQAMVLNLSGAAEATGEPVARQMPGSHHKMFW